MNRADGRREGESGRVTPWHDDFEDPSLLRDSDGNKYMFSDEDYKEVLDSHTHSRSKQIELQIAKELLSSNLNRLTGRQREVMYYALLGYSLEGTAKEIGITSTTVQEHLERARKKLAKYITGTREILEEGLNNGINDNH